MLTNGYEKNNKVYVSGKIVSDAEFSHEVYGEGFYEMKLEVRRLSGQADILPVTVSERLIAASDLKVGQTLSAVGQFRHFDETEDGGKGDHDRTLHHRLCSGDFHRKIPPSDK